MLYFTLFYVAVFPTVLSSEDDLMERDHRNTGPVTHISKKENEKSAVFSKQNQAEIKTAFQQEKIELQEKEITKLKAELEGATKAFRQITEEASARGKTIIDNFAVFSFYWVRQSFIYSCKFLVFGIHVTECRTPPRYGLRRQRHLEYQAIGIIPTEQNQNSCITIFSKLVNLGRGDKLR